MRILNIINNLQPAGAESLLAEIAIALQKKGVHSEVATLFRYPEKSLYQRLVQSGVVVHSLDFSFRYDMRIPGALRRLAENTSYDIVHANLFPAFYWTALARPKCKRMILTEHNTFNRRQHNPLLKPVERFVYGRYNSIVCITNSVRDSLATSLPLLAERMSVIYNGVDTERFRDARPANRQELGVPFDAPLCIMVSRFYKPKDHKTVIDAAALVPDLHVLFAGEGELEPAAKRHAQEAGVGSRIHFLGLRSDIPSLLKASDLCVHSSYNEGFSLAVVEAMACGIPVVASDVRALNEIVQDKVSGLLFDCGDPKQLAQKIGMVLHDQVLNAKLRQGALARADDFSLKNTVSKLLTLYNS
jgi:glycosyltransferase involved in cell wall biosynthesis